MSIAADTAEAAAQGRRMMSSSSGGGALNRSRSAETLNRSSTSGALSHSGQANLNPPPASGSGGVSPPAGGHTGGGVTPPSGGASPPSGGGGNYTPNPRIRPHGQQPRPRPPGMQSHHPEQQSALRRVIANYDPNADPTLLMSTAQHQLTFAPQAAQRARGEAFYRELGTPAALEEVAQIMQQAGVPARTAGQVTLEHAGYLFSTTPLDQVLQCLPPGP